MDLKQPDITNPAKGSGSDLPNVSIVVIGYNESRVLAGTLKAVQEIDYPRDKYEIIYSDNGSDDDSVKIASQYVDRVVTITGPWRSASQTFNKGIEESRFDIIHFIGSDIAIDPHYLRKAVKMTDSEGIACVFGYLEEQTAGLNRLVLDGWQDKSEGFKDAPGGGGTFQKNLLMKIDGFDERILRGQESEIGERIRGAGGKIYMLNACMGVHDFEINSWWSFFVKHIRDGLSMSHMMIASEPSEFIRRARKKWYVNIGYGLIFCLIAFLSVMLRNPWLLPLFVALYFVLTFVRYAVVRRVSNSRRLMYLMLLSSVRPAIFLGIVYYAIRTLGLLISGVKIPRHRRKLADLKSH